MAKKKVKTLGDRAKKVEGRMKVLLAMKYKKGMIYVRQIDQEVFIWDAIYKNKLYSSYIIITLKKGTKKLPNDILDEARQMCYAGAASTIDIQMGDKLSKKVKDTLKTFEKGRKQVESIAN